MLSYFEISTYRLPQVSASWRYPIQDSVIGGKGRNSTLWVSGVFLVSFLVLLLLMPRDLGIYDESLILVDAGRVLHGEVLHRDFYSNYGPAQYYIVAGLFRIFGVHFMVGRLYDLTLRAAITGTIFWVIAVRASKLLASLFAALAVLWFMAVGSFLYPVFPCALLAILSSHLIARPKESARRYLLAGGYAGLAALFRYETGFYLMVANLATLAILASQEPSPLRLRRLLRKGFFYICGTSAVFVPVATVFLTVSPVRYFVNDIIAYPSKYYRRMRGLPFPQISLHRLAEDSVYWPLIAVGLAGAFLGWRYRERRALVSFGSLTSFGITTLALFLTGIVRIAPEHAVLSVLPSLVLTAVLVQTWIGKGMGWRFAASGVLLLCVGLTVGEAIAGTWQIHYNRGDSVAEWFAMRRGWLHRSVADQSRCEEALGSGLARLAPDQARIANYLAVHSLPSEAVFVGLGRHDKIYINDIGIYFAAGRRPGTHWHHFDPGLQTRADIQQQIIDDLQRNQVRWIARDTEWDGIQEPNESAKSSGVFLLDQYIAAHYRPVAASGKSSVWLLKGQVPVAYQPDVPCEAGPIL